jgi:hypothetical protein
MPFIEVKCLIFCLSCGWSCNKSVVVNTLILIVQGQVVQKPVSSTLGWREI